MVSKYWLIGFKCQGEECQTKESAKSDAELFAILYIEKGAVNITIDKLKG